MNGIVRYGVLGTGMIASRMVNNIRESRNSEVSAVASSSKEKAAAFARKFNIKRPHSGYLSLLDDESVDAVYIALPNSMHFEFCKQALERGKHVLCEKPFILESRQVDILEGIAKKKGLKLMESLWYRFHPLVDMVIRSVKSDLGAPLGFYSTFSFANTSENDIRWTPALGGGALYDLMCYHVDAVNYIFKPDLDQWRCVEAFGRQRNRVEANVSVEALLFDKFQIFISSSIDRESINRTTIVGTGATLVIPNLRMSPEITDSFFYLIKDGKMLKIQAENCNAYVRMVEAFSNAVIKRSPVPVEPRESRCNLILLERIKSALQIEMSDRVALYPKASQKVRAIISNIKRKLWK